MNDFFDFFHRVYPKNRKFKLEILTKNNKYFLIPNEVRRYKKSPFGLLG
ncbi:colicin [Campylobacter jejuni]|nr:colicin [Campylobacter jejuni]AZU51769.1 colicin [Campylobacter jejuni subsp. jejuni]EAH4479981.1 colicin [Campylobacter coli]EIB42558.1 colicin E1 immunity protein [Campylobacter jejuni subsp. jejuni ATCC 33560]EAB5306286.1 colicin [Campylobacter jejuni]